MNPLQPSAPFEGIRDALPADEILVALPADPLPTPSPRRRGWPVLAWLAIIAVAGFIVYRQATRKGSAEMTAAESIVTMQMQARYLVGAASVSAAAGTKPDALYEQARESMDQGSYSQRLRFVVVAGELMGPREALDALKRLEEDRREGQLVPLNDVSIEAARKLERLYRGYLDHPGKPSLPASDQQWLRERLGWFGELALAPADGDSEAREKAMAPALRTLVVYVSLVGLGLLGLCAGGFLLLLVVLLVVLGRLRGGLTCGTDRGGIYAETFALYLVSFIAMSFAARYLPIPPNIQIGASAVAAFLSLFVLLWPLLRGITWAQLRDDLGLHMNGNPLGQILSGVGCYLCALPILVVGVLITLALMFVHRLCRPGEPITPPSHPIILETLGSNAWIWLQIFLAACVAAPIVEEIMFRGVLYRHLREASCRWGRVMSILFSAVLTSFVFAVIHPQGWLGVPPLMALAIAFSLAREWRGSLAPCMIAHGINNGVITLMLMLATA